MAPHILVARKARCFSRAHLGAHEVQRWEEQVREENKVQPYGNGLFLPFCRHEVSTRPPAWAAELFLPRLSELCWETLTFAY